MLDSTDAGMEYFYETQLFLVVSFCHIVNQCSVSCHAMDINYLSTNASENTSLYGETLLSRQVKLHLSPEEVKLGFACLMLGKSKTYYPK